MLNVVNDRSLAQYASLGHYTPQPGDYIIRAKWFTTWHGIVREYNPDSGMVSIIFEGLPSLLVQLAPDEYLKNTYEVGLSSIRKSPQGKWAALQLDPRVQSNVWYV